MNERHWGLDIFRILVMLMIVIIHALTNSGALYDIKNLSNLNNMAWYLEALCIMGVNGFFLLTGYFGINSVFKLSKLKKIWLEVWFYSVVIYVFTVLTGIAEFKIKDFIFCLFPIITNRYWFMLTYIVLYLLMPYINVLINGLQQRQHLKLIFISLVFFCLHPNFIPTRLTLDQTAGYGIIWAITLYIIAAYVRIYQVDKKVKSRRKMLLMGYFIISILMLISEILIIKYQIASGDDSRGKFYAYNSITVLGESLCLFLYFASSDFLKNRNLVKVKRFIGGLSSSTLAVYLIHAHPNLYAPIWKWLKASNYAEGSIVMFVGVLITACLFYFSVCIVIDKLKIFLFQSVRLWGVGKIEKSIKKD